MDASVHEVEVAKRLTLALEDAKSSGVPAFVTALDAVLLYTKVREAGGFLQLMSRPGSWNEIANQVNVSGGARAGSALKRLYRDFLYSVDLGAQAEEFAVEEMANEERFQRLGNIVRGMQFWLEEMASHPLEIVHHLYVHLATSCELLVSLLVNMLATSFEIEPRLLVLTMVQELSYEHKEFATCLVKHAKFMLRVSRDSEDVIQHLACKSLQNMSWWQDHAKPLVDAGALSNFVRIVEKPTSPVKNIVAAVSTLANITDHDTKYCRDLLNLKKLEFWVQKADSEAPALQVAALHLLESLTKNVTSLRSRKLREINAIGSLCNIITRAQAAGHANVVKAAADALREACRNNENRLTALELLNVSSLDDLESLAPPPAKKSSAAAAIKRKRGTEEVSPVKNRRTSPRVLPDEQPQLQQQQQQQLQQHQQVPPQSVYETNLPMQNVGELFQEKADEDLERFHALHELLLRRLREEQAMREQQQLEMVAMKEHCRRLSQEKDVLLKEVASLRSN